ncbi:MAG: TIGR00725 family protein [Nitrospirae bacterium]|nr:MAG: TIGR00725 family protein [Nitrospirota bacterium]
MPKIIAVIGGRRESEELLKSAEEVGRLIAEKGAVLLCGGLTGVMEAASKGAKHVGGITVGILPSSSKLEANPYIDVPLATGLGLARNVIIVTAADGVIAVGGGLGTLSEIAYALQFNKYVVGINTWEIEGVIKANKPEEAVDTLFNLIYPPL